jgi:hypothetical protein
MLTFALGMTYVLLVGQVRKGGGTEALLPSGPLIIAMLFDLIMIVGAAGFIVEAMQCAA